MSGAGAGRVAPTLQDALDWAADGAAHLRGLMERMGDDAFAAPSALPGWTRAHVLTHVARNAEAMVNLLSWARTGTVTPAYASREQRDADIEAGATRPPDVIRADVVATSDQLAQVVRDMPEQAWSATVRNVLGVEIPAKAIPWIRARETWIHSVDLDVGGSLDDLPQPMLDVAIADVLAGLGAVEGCPPLRVIPDDRNTAWATGDGTPTTVLGPVAGLLGWLVGRSAGNGLRALDAGGQRVALPRLPAWL